MTSSWVKKMEDRLEEATEFQPLPLDWESLIEQAVTGLLEQVPMSSRSTALEEALWEVGERVARRTERRLEQQEMEYACYQHDPLGYVGMQASEFL